MTATLEPLLVSELTNKGMVDSVLWDRLVNRILRDHFDKREAMRPSAEQILDQALGFLRLCAQEPDGNFGPSPTVDVGWHTFILYTREYADFCQRFAGRFLHHCPSDEPGVDYGTGGVTRTVTAMRAAGISVVEALWVAAGACLTEPEPGDCSGDCNHHCTQKCRS